MAANDNTTPVGYYEGVLDVYYAVMTAEGVAPNTLPTYGTPAIMGHSMEVKVTPRYKEGKVYASNVAQRYVKKLDGYDVSIKVDQLATGVHNTLVGRTSDANGVTGTTGDDKAPEVAIGFALPLDNGQKELWWLVRGKFSDIGIDTKTEEESVEFQHPTMEGRFDRRVPDNRLSYIVNTGDLSQDKASVGTGWFSAVYAGAGT